MTRANTRQQGDQVTVGRGRTVYVVTDVYASGDVCVARAASDPKTRTCRIVAGTDVHQVAPNPSTTTS